MDGWKKWKQLYHRLMLRVQTSQRVQIAVGALLLLSIILPLALIVFSTPDTSFVQFEVTRCYDRAETSQGSPSDISLSLRDGFMEIAYTFNQKCYRAIETDHTSRGNSITLLVSVREMAEDCFCNTDVNARIGPMDDGIYTLNIRKRADTDDFLVHTQQVQIG